MIASMSGGVSCSCDACQHIDTLRLKLVVHSGRAVVYSIAGNVDLSGVDVIIAHRLLKNSVPSHEYILLTEAAERDLRIDLPRLWSGEEVVAGIGSLHVTAFDST